MRALFGAGILVLAGLRCSAVALSSHPPIPQIEGSTFERGKVIADPEALSGIWEALDEKGGVIGIHLLVDTTASSAAKSLDRTEQHWQQLNVGIYHRATADVNFADRNYFVASTQAGGVRLANGRLSLHFQSFDLDLRQIPGDRWSGRIHRGAFDQQVVLSRSLRKREVQLAGRYLEGNRCLELYLPSCSRSSAG